jgi:hypothetical protein
VSRWLTVVCLAIALHTNAVAEVQPVVRVEVIPETVAVGESVEMRVTVLVPTWFARPPVYPAFELSNAITRLPADSSYPTRERIGKESWSGIVRSYRVYPLVGASYRLEGQSIRVAYANPGAEPVILDVAIPDIQFRAIVPAGAEGVDPYIAGRGLKLALDVEGDVDSLEAGAALVLHYTAELDGLPAIFLPPLAPELNFNGVSLYADEPEVDDRTPARRSEKITLVFDAGGEFEVPGIELEFWNTETRTVERATAAGVSLSVAGPVATAPSSGTKPGPDWRRLGMLLAGPGGLAIALWLWGPVVLRRYVAARQRRRDSEAYAFSLLCKALRAGKSGQAYHALLAWVERLQPGMDARRFARDYGDSALENAVSELSGLMYSDAEISADMRRLDAGLAAARGRYYRQLSKVRQQHLPPLNP